VAPNLLIFLRINEHTGQLLVGPNALWPTQLGERIVDERDQLD